MINNIFKNKFFVVFSIALIIIFSFFNSCFASTIEKINFDYNGKSYSLPMFNRETYDSSKDALIFCYNYKGDFNNFCFVYVKNAKSYIKDGYELRVVTSSAGGFYRSRFYCYRSSDDVTTNDLGFYILRYTNNPNDSWSNWGNLLTYTDALESKLDLIKCDVDIYKQDGSIFFQKTPVTAVEIPALETAKQVPEAMATALKMIIPIGLAVLSIPLLIYLMRRLIYRSL